MFKYFLILIVPLCGHAQICEMGRHWVRAHHRRAYYRADGTFVSASNVTAHCQANSKSYDFWKDKFKSGTPKGWPHNEIPQPWTEDERERVFEALDEIPDDLKPKTMTGLYRFKQSIVRDNAATSGEGGIISLYDAAFEKQRLARVLSHELGHEYFEQMTESEKDGYLKAAKWRKVGQPGRLSLIPRQSGYVEPDGPNSLEEDFANNLEYILFEPQILQSVTPTVYHWIRTRFGPQFKIKGAKK